MRMRFTLGAVLMAFIALGAFAQNAQAQPGWNWPNDEEMKAVAVERNVLYTDYYKQDNYASAKTPLVWLLKNTPDLNNSIYINGIKIYESLADAEKNAAQKAIYADSAMLLYDLRMKYFGDEANVTDRKAFAAYKYYKDDKAKYPELYALFQKTYELNGNNVMDANTVFYMYIVSKYKLSGGPLSDEDVIDIYGQISDVLAYKISKKVNEERLTKMQEQIDALLSATVTVDCQFVENNLGPKMKADPSNLKMSKKVFQLLLNGKCSDSPLFVESAILVDKSEPTFSLKKVIALKARQNNDFETAEKYFKEALELADDNTKKGDIYLQLAEMSATRGQKVAARDYARKTLAADPTKSEAYSLIGNLYYGSFDECKKGENKVLDRAVFLAAYEMYKRAGNSTGMQASKNQFPSIQDIFDYDMKVGDNITCGCWINETVVLQRRD